MFNWLQISAGAALGALIAVGPVYLYGHSKGVDDERVSQLKASVEAQIKREGIENDVSDMDRYAVCVDLGGMPSDCEQLRGMEKSTEAEGRSKANTK